MKHCILKLAIFSVGVLLMNCQEPVTTSPDSNNSPSPKVINLLSIAGVTPPAYGATPVTTITETAQYTGTVTWSGSPSSFAATTVYTATLTLTPKSGYTLNGLAANTFTVAGASATNPADSGVVTAVFPATGAAPDAVINIAAIPGVTAPVAGAIPVIAVGSNDQYTGTITWSPPVSNKFISNTVYTATITLAAKADFTLNGVAADFFTVSGAVATNSLNSGVVSAVFTTTAANLAAVNDVTSTTQSSILLKAVQGGTFNNGTANMTVSSFRMSQHEITKEQFVAVTGLPNPSTSFTGVVNGPVQKVSWYHALVFCNKLSEADGLTPVYSIGGTTNTDSWGTIPTTDSDTWNSAIADWTANGYRLPTEAEWQFAARGGNNSHNYTYAGSDTIANVAWYSSNSSNTTHTVGGKTANELGLKDMSGNVWEWCWDRDAAYPGTAQTDYRGPATGTFRVLHGGSWSADAPFCTANSQGSSSPSNRNLTVGYRVVRP